MFRKNPPINGKHKQTDNNHHFWQAKASFVKDKPEIQTTFGRPIAFESPEQLWQGCCEYFEWVENNPIFKSELLQHKGIGSLMNVPKMRAMTISGLCLFLRITEQTWRDYRNNKGTGYSLVCSIADTVIYTQKFTGAAANLLNQFIIARDLGLREQHEVVGKDGGPIQTQRVPVDLSQLDEEELEVLANMIDRASIGEGG